MKLRINIDSFRIITIFLLAFSFTRKIGGEYLPWYLPYIVTMPLFIVLGNNYFNSEDYHNHEISKKILLLACIPYIVALLYSFILKFLGEGTINAGLRAVSVSVQIALDVSLAVLLFSYFLDDAMDIIEDAIIASYLFTFITAVLNIGFKGVEQYISTVSSYETELNVWLEMHDIGLSVGMLILFELFIKKNKRLGKIIFLSIIFLLCFKRIALLAFVVASILWMIVFRKRRGFKDFQITLIMLAVLISCMIYVMLISTGALYTLASQYGISFANRQPIYAVMSRYYDWSIGFKGHGLGFTNKYLSLEALRSNMVAYVHNDILKTYIDLGFIGSIIWFAWYTWKMPVSIMRHFGSDAQSVYCLLTIYAYIVYTTDNTSEYFIFQTVLYSIILYGCSYFLPNSAIYFKKSDILDNVFVEGDYR